MKKKIHLKEINGILENFFSSKEISDFGRNFPGRDFSETEVLTLSPVNKRQIEADIAGTYLKQVQYDVLTTFAEQKLDKFKYISFLLSMGEYLISAGEFSFAVDIHRKILAETESEIQFKNIAANALYALGEIFSREAKWLECFEYTKRAFNLFKQQNDFKGCARCENLLGSVYGDQGELKEAASHFQESLHYLDEKNDAVLMGRIENNLGIINNIYSNYDKALFYYNRALIKFQRLNDHLKIAQIRHNVGITYIKKKEYAKALNELDKSIAISLNDSIYSLLGISYVTKAYIYALNEDIELSKAFADKAMEICYRTNDKLSVAEIYKVEGMLKRIQKKYLQAESYLKTSLRINREYRNKLNEAETNLELGILYKQWKKPDQAWKCFEDSLHYFKKIKAVKEIENIEQYLNE
ncbi:MAG TPA: tetratricopeptide repeat protein [Ignavibacteriaceae bacterium]|nr:tetratricopeptide repeat protein [Ignavibacteriaceae bacterium]